MSELKMVIGVSGSGKSRYAEKIKEYIHLSSDKIRLDLFGTLEHQKDHDQVFAALHELVQLYSARGNNIIYDATNLNRKLRTHFYNEVLRPLDKLGKKPIVEAIVFIEPFDVILANNLRKKVEAQVSLEVLKRMYPNLQVPRPGVDCDLYSVEGETRFFKSEMTYEKLIEINSLRELVNYISEPYELELSKLFGPHDTPYHLESIEEHINMCIENSDGDELLKVVSMFHDLGKSFTKDGGKYFGHERVSAMYAAKAFSEITDMPEHIRRDAIEMIYQHMNAHQGMGEKVIKNNKITPELLEKIKKFAEIDSKSRRMEIK